VAAAEGLSVLIAGGGTGGHLFPGIALARELERRSRARVRFLGSSHGIERQAVPRAGYPVELLEIRGLRREGIAGLARLALQVPRALLAALRSLRRDRPDLTVGVGGYAAMPGLAASVALKVPIVLLEQNAIPGLTTRLFAPFARRVCVSFAETRARVGRRAVLTGNPVRLPAATSPRAASPDRSGGAAADPHRHHVFGGSAGAHHLNVVVPEAVAAAGVPIEVVHQTGEQDRDAVAQCYGSLGLAAGVHAFIDDMAAAYDRADLVLCRAGATTVAELTALGRPSILVPFPFAAGDHQRHNAEALVREGAAWLILDRELAPAALADHLRRAAADREGLRAMGERARALGRPDATARVADECLAVVGEAS
jgi:UDP-N-acetylglucosamine--N-acetylmuramyl-(pentapeptide) pyrophosphoryl-undecaprenol N-acetylglucosamine transferase